MIRSMTGFGRGEGTFDGGSVTVELKSVNHRYFEYSSRLPRSCAFLDEPLKNLLKTKISRGKVEAFVTLETVSSDAVSIEINKTYADEYVKALKSLGKLYGVKNDITASVIASNSEIFSVSKKTADEEELKAAVLAVAELAVNSFIEMRETEGLKLRDDVVSRLDYILDRVAFVEERSPETVKLYRERLEERIKELLSGADVDEQRIITETAIFADKVAVAEETVRLRSHIDQFKTLLESNEPIGRKVDFLVQEMNRETNTIGSKAQDIEISHVVVDIKAEIEKIREQIQNIE